MNTVSPFKSHPEGQALKDVTVRKKNWKSGKTPYTNISVRNPAWCKVTANGVSVPEAANTFQQLYQTDFKVGPILNQCTIRHIGDLGLLIEIDAEIQCHTRSQFERIEDAYCKHQTEVKVEFGYAPAYPDTGEGYTSQGKLEKCQVAKFAFNATPEGFWVVKFTAIAPAAALTQLEISTKIADDLLSGKKYKAGKVFGSDKMLPVTGLMELMTYHAQGNGQFAVDQLQKDPGEAIYISDSPAGRLGHAVIVSKKHLMSGIESLGTKVVSFFSPGNQVTETPNIVVYYTLEYFVNVINSYILASHAKKVNSDVPNAATASKLKIKFDPELSFSYVNAKFQSAYPTGVLILGDNGGSKCGNYLNSEGKGRDFEKVLRASDVKAIQSDPYGSQRYQVDLRKILIERDILFDALQLEYTKPNAATKVDPKQTTEGGQRLFDVFGKVFTKISEASGGAIKLRLSMHPMAFSNPDQMYEMYVFDENNGYTNERKCFVFDPIDYDGSTRSCTLTSGVGSEEYQGKIFSDIKKSSDPVNWATLKRGDKDTQLPSRKTQYNQCVQQLDKLIRNPGPLGESRFDVIHMNAIQEALSSMRVCASEGKKVDLPIYPGLGIDIEIDGVWGFLPGNAISTTQLTQRYFEAKTFFLLTSVEHQFNGSTSDWMTKLQGNLAFHDQVDYDPNPDTPPAKMAPSKSTPQAGTSRNTFLPGGGAASGGKVKVGPGGTGAGANLPTRGGKTFNAGISEGLAEKSGPVLNNNGLVVTDTNDTAIHKSIAQQTGESYDANFADYSKDPDRIANAINDGDQNGLKMVYEVKTPEERDAIVSERPDIADSVKVVPHATAPHFSVYNR